MTTKWHEGAAVEAAFTQIAEALPEHFAGYRQNLLAGNRPRLRALNSLLHELRTFATESVYCSAPADMDLWRAWWRLYSAATHLRAALWAAKASKSKAFVRERLAAALASLEVS